MKRILILAAAAAAIFTPAASAQDAPALTQRAWAAYDLTTLYPKGASNEYLNGFAIGYNADFRVSRTMPLYVGTGLNARFLFQQKDLIAVDMMGAAQQNADITFINLNVPVNVSYRIPVADGFYLTPELGLDLRVQLYGHAKIHTDIEGYVPGLNLGEVQAGSQGLNLFSNDDLGSAHLRRFQLGWHAALNFEYRQFTLGLSYGTDFVKLHKNLGAGHFLASVGYRF